MNKLILAIAQETERLSANVMKFYYPTSIIKFNEINSDVLTFDDYIQYKECDYYLNESKVEVKNDMRSEETGNIAIQCYSVYRYNRIPSGIMTSKSDFYHIKHKNQFLEIKTADLIDYMKDNRSKLARFNNNKNNFYSCDTGGYLIKIDDIEHAIKRIDIPKELLEQYEKNIQKIINENSYN